MPFFFEGAFGTYYYNKTSSAGPCELGNISDPDTVMSIHSEYAVSGADAIKTNTFGANRINFPDTETLDRILSEGSRLAKDSVKGTKVRVFADIGPVESGQDLAEQEEEYLYIARRFAELGAVDFIFETMSEFRPLTKAVSYIRSNVPGAFVVVSFAVMQDGYSAKGLYYKTLLQQAADFCGIDVCGLNCLCGPSHLYELLKELPRLPKPVCAMPNSGYPSHINGRTVYIDNSDYFAGRLRDIASLGIGYLGGCCGTTPEHISKAIALITGKRSDGWRYAGPGGKQKAEEKAEAKTEGTQAKPCDHDILSITNGRKLIAIEIDPPADTNADFLINASLKAAKAGADIITIADSPLARTRADSIMTAAKILREADIPVMPHLSCRDRNQIGIKASLLGASIEGVRNVLVVTGDPVSSSDKAEIKGMFSFNSFKLISYIKSLNEEVFAHAPFTVAAALNVNAPKFDAELMRAEQKLKSGAGFFLTQPVFSQDAVGNIARAREVLGDTILAGILPVAGYRNALFLNNEVPGINIPSDFVGSLRDLSKDECDDRIAGFMSDIIDSVWDHVRGYYLITPMQRIDSICKLADIIKKTEKEGRK